MKKIQGISLLLLVLLLFSNSIPLVFAKTRQKYLSDFLIECKIEERGFSNSVQKSNEISFEATAHAIEMLKAIEENYDEKINITLFEESLTTSLNNYLKNEVVLIYELYYLVKALTLLGVSIKQETLNSISNYLNELSIATGGFSSSNTTSSANIISTYYALALHALINKQIENKELHEKWILSCQNNDGGFGGTKTASSSIISTFYAISALSLLYNLSKYDNLETTALYLNETFVNDNTDQENYGGYLPHEGAEKALLSSTYFCSKAISLINGTKLNDKKELISNWVLNQQNPLDGGFVERNMESGAVYSSIIASYYAFETLKIFDVDLTSLQQDVYEVEFNYWVLIILGIIAGVLVSIYIYIKRKRRLI
ncbi:MAG: prenyltransferase/squalene oxidase repeat-containing protein [Promethearchaeota archaeon]